MKSVARSTTILENYKSRMQWINSAADQFHRLMQTQEDYMEKELQAIAGWVGASQASAPNRYYRPF